MKSAKLYGMCWAAAGCLAMILVVPALWAQETKEKVTVDDVDRTFMFGYPRDTTKQHYPVVILLHGLNQDADDIERLTQFNGLADKNGIIVVYPSALNGRWNMGVRPGAAPDGRWGRVGGAHAWRLRRWRLSWRGGGGYPGGGGQQPAGRDPSQERAGSGGRYRLLQPDARLPGPSFPSIARGFMP